MPIFLHVMYDRQMQIRETANQFASDIFCVGLSRSGESLQIYKLAIGLSAALTVVLALVISIAVITGGVWGKHHIRKEKKRKSLKLEGGTTSASNSYIERIS